jgi:hypothetical protein
MPLSCPLLWPACCLAVDFFFFNFWMRFMIRQSCRHNRMGRQALSLLGWVPGTQARTAQMRSTKRCGWIRPRSWTRRPDTTVSVWADWALLSDPSFFLLRSQFRRERERVVAVLHLKPAPWTWKLMTLLGSQVKYLFVLLICKPMDPIVTQDSRSPPLDPRTKV